MPQKALSMDDLPGVLVMEEVPGFFPNDERLKKSILGGILGVCVGDALGVPVEFTSREELEINPVSDMCGYGTYNQPPGTWSDDTSLTLCLLDSLANGLDYNDIMQKFLSWAENADYTAHGVVFDMGIATRKALTRFAQRTNPLKCGGTSEFDNGNGALMRILPTALYLYLVRWGNGYKFIEEDGYKKSEDELFGTIHNVCSLTHAHKRSQIACGIYCSIVEEMIVYNEKQKSKPTIARDVFDGIYRAKKYYESHNEYLEELQHYKRIFSDNFVNLQQDKIKSSSYVVDTLEAALWCLMNTHNYKDCVLKTVNLGEDTDTVAAVAGGLAGLYYGYDSIPSNWVNQIARLDYIRELCEKLY